MTKPESPHNAESNPVEQHRNDVRAEQTAPVPSENKEELAAAVEEVKRRLEQNGGGPASEDQNEERFPSESSETFDLFDPNQSKLLEKVIGVRNTEHKLTGNFREDFQALLRERKDHDKEVGKTIFVVNTGLGALIASGVVATTWLGTGSIALTATAAGIMIPIVGGGVLVCWGAAKFIQHLNHKNLEARARRL